MTKFVLAYHGGHGMPEGEAEQAAIYAAWGAWFGQLGDAVVDGGNPIKQARTVGPDGSVGDGGGANPITGYSLIQAESLEAAVALAKGCPVLSNGGSVEVAEALPM